MRIYICGSITGRTKQQLTEFHVLAHQLRAAGHEEVLNPLEQDVALGIKSEDANFNGKHRRLIMQADCNWILSKADILYVLPDHDSSGCRAEIALAKSCSIPIKYLRKKKQKTKQSKTLNEPASTILSEV
jgi:hypothetical protein